MGAYRNPSLCSGKAFPVERIVVDATFGLYLGWVSVATFANIAAVVTDPGADEPQSAVTAIAMT